MKPLAYLALVLGGIALSVLHRFGEAAAEPRSAGVTDREAALLDEEERHREQVLDAALHESRERIAAKSAVAWSLIRGEIGLPEAAARFRDITPAEVGFGAWSAINPGASEEEFYYRNVIAWVASVMQGPPGWAERVAALEAELQRLLASGALPFPERGPADSGGVREDSCDRPM